MARPLIATKLFVPQTRPNVVARPRLLERLQRGAGARLTLVSAPAGFGKTTLLAEWLGTMQSDRIAWVSLDAADSDPASFWAYVVAALQKAVPGIGSSAVELIASSPEAVEPALTAVLNDLALAPADAWLVLDDYHLVDSRDVGTGMAFLLEHLPPHVHVMISTRADPELPLSRRRVRGELVEVRAADLRFTPDEAAAYLNEASGLDLSAADVAALQKAVPGIGSSAGELIASSASK
ncbi:MAG: ATP-dependent transcriptional regulator, MalT-like, LuxR family, partial [Pseudarthrobacter sp.]|nr:ATP-dependent transcriptional regulator, MalT-like, LuxR family [Pseudarthrobacter sp.]